MKTCANSFCPIDAEDVAGGVVLRQDLGEKLTELSVGPRVPEPELVDAKQLRYHNLLLPEIKNVKSNNVVLTHS